MRSEQVLAHGALFFAQLSFSTWHILGKVVLNAGVTPLVFAAYRELIAAFLLFGVALLSTGWGTQSAIAARLIVPLKTDLLRVFAMGVCSFGNVGGFVVGLSLTSAPNAASLQPSVPIIALLIAVIIGQENLTAFKLLGVAFVVLGSMLVVVFDPEFDDASSGAGSHVVLGNIVLLLQCAALATLLVIQKAIVHRYHPIWLTAYYYSIGGALTWLACLYYVERREVFDIGSEPVWLVLIFASVFATVIAYCIYTWSASYLDASVISLYSSVQVVTTTALSVAFLGHVVIAAQAAGALLIIVGLCVTVWAQTRDTAVASNAETAKLLAYTDVEH